jgi:hypothetical protein
METLYAIGMLVGLMNSHAEPPKAVAPVVQHQVEQRQIEHHQVEPRPTEADKPRPRKKVEWLLSY